MTFYYSPMLGRTNSPENFTSLLTDVTERLFGQLPDATWVYPGHGNDTTLGTARPHLGEWRERGWWGPPRMSSACRRARTTGWSAPTASARPARPPRSRPRRGRRPAAGTRR